MAKSAADSIQEDDDDKVRFIDIPVTEAMAEMLLSDMKYIAKIEYNDYEFHLEIDEVTPEALEVARVELREEPEIVENAVEELRALLKQENGLIVPLHKKQWLIKFLRPCKYYANSAFELIKRYYKFKIKHPDIYDGLLPSKVVNVFKDNILVFQQERDQFGRRIVMVDIGKKWKPSVVPLDDFFKAIVLLLELGMLEPTTQICGLVVIFDVEGLSLYQATKFTPHFIKRLLDWIQSCVSLRIKNIHVVNQSYVFNIILKMMKPFMGEKLRSRFILHGNDRKSLHRFISPKCLPEKYGGELKLPRVKSNDWIELLQRCDEEYKAINRYGYVNK